jgi:hypothetical protein
MGLHDMDPGALDQGALPQTPSLPGTQVNLPDGCGQGADPEELHYAPVPPRKTITVSVRYTVRGRGRPLPYALEEGGGE